MLDGRIWIQSSFVRRQADELNDCGEMEVCLEDGTSSAAGWWTEYSNVRTVCTSVRVRRDEGRAVKHGLNFAEGKTFARIHVARSVSLELRGDYLALPRRLNTQRRLYKGMDEAQTGTPKRFYQQYPPSSLFAARSLHPYTMPSFVNELYRERESQGESRWGRQSSRIDGRTQVGERRKGPNPKSVRERLLARVTWNEGLKGK